MSSQFAIPSPSWSCKTSLDYMHTGRLAMLVILVLELSIIHWVKYNCVILIIMFFATNIFLGVACTFSVVWLCTQPNHYSLAARAPPSCSASWTREHISRLTVVQVMGELGEGLGIRLSLEYNILCWQYEHHKSAIVLKKGSLAEGCIDLYNSIDTL